jgi:aminopeptidase N
MYPKGGEMLHTIRQIVGDDEKWRRILTGLNRTFWHQTVMGKQIENYISAQAGVNLTKVFDQYLRTAMVPTFEYKISNDTLSYRWATVVPGFDMQMPVMLDGKTYTKLRPSEQWKTVKLTAPAEFKVDENYYVIPKLIP